jgi:hypothetical protein
MSGDVELKVGSQGVNTEWHSHSQLANCNVPTPRALFYSKSAKVGRVD